MSCFNFVDNSIQHSSKQVISSSNLALKSFLRICTLKKTPNVCKHEFVLSSYLISLQFITMQKTMARDRMTISVSSPKYKTEKRAITIEGKRNLNSYQPL